MRKKWTRGLDSDGVETTHWTGPRLRLKVGRTQPFPKKAELVKQLTDAPRRDPRYPSTAWTVIRGAQGVDTLERSRALERLLSVYWRPIYWTFRLDWNALPDEAKDLTQEYLATFLEKRMVVDVQRDRGRFRAYVKATIKHFMLSHRRAHATRKRGGGRRFVALDQLDEIEARSEAQHASPPKRFERELMRSIIDAALAELEAACRREGRERDYTLFHTYYLEQAEGRAPRYDDLRRRFDLGAHDVKNRLAVMRARFRQAVLDLLRDGTSSEEELVREIREVLQA